MKMDRSVTSKRESTATNTSSVVFKGLNPEARE